MKHTLLTLGAILTAVVFGSSAAGAQGYVNQVDVDATNRVYTSVSAFFDETNDSSSTPESVVSKATAASSSLDSLIAHSFSTKLGDTYVKEADNLKDAAKSLQAKINGVSAAIDTQDEATITAYFEGLSAEAKAFDVQIEKLNASVEEANTSMGTGYLWMVIAAGAIAAAAFGWAFGTKKPTDKDALKAKRTIAYASLAPLAGALITYISFMAADSTGGGYLIAWGPIVVGVIIMIRSVMNYISVTKGKTPPAATPKAV